MAVIQPALCSALTRSARIVVPLRGVPVRVIGPGDGRQASVHRCSRQNEEDRAHGACSKYPGNLQMGVLLGSTVQFGGSCSSEGAVVWLIKGLVSRDSDDKEKRGGCYLEINCFLFALCKGAYLSEL